MGEEGFSPPETQYARSGEVHIAYKVIGDCPGPDLVFMPGGSTHVELIWQMTGAARLLWRLASLSRLIIFDKRGTGISDPVQGVPSLEVRMDDIHAVMDAAGSQHAILFAVGDSGPLSVLFAATYPERTAALVLFAAFPSFVRSPDMPWLPTRAELEQWIEEVARRWADPSFHDETLKKVAPNTSDEDRSTAARVTRLSTSPGAAAAYARMSLEVDVRDVLPLINVPTLVMYRADAAFPPGIQRTGCYLADRIPGARLVELPGAEFGPTFGDQERLVAALERFLAETLEGQARPAPPDRVLATVLFTDVVGATARAAELGDRAWRELLEQHHAAVRTELGRFRGAEVDTAGDGFFATFDGPARAIRCACAIRESVRELGLEVRAGLHTGECELVDRKVGGIAVHIGARVAVEATPGEVLVSSTVRDLVAGSGITFEGRGEAALKGVPGEWRLFAVSEVPAD